MQRLLHIVFLFTIITFASAQNPHKKTASGQTRKFSSATVIFKVRREFKELFNKEKEKCLGFQKIHKELGIKKIERLFPGIEAPKKLKNHLGQSLVDLTGIYKLNYSSNIPVSKAIEKIVKSGMVLYAEPEYQDELLYIPNDPFVDSNLAHIVSPNFYLKNMKYYEALDSTKGDTNIVIGIIDTGVKLDHEDLKNNLKYNYADPINGVDDDNDGFLDNFHGWDVGMNDNDPTAVNGHGVEVSGCSSASTDNGLGVPGIGFKCKFLPIKAASDAANSAIIQGYSGIIYAADHGCKVINLSWGGPGGYSSTLQDVINYAAINKDIVVVAAAGNDGLDNAYYPASYENVLSVAAIHVKYESAVDSLIEYKPSFATYNYHVDVCAQGQRVSSTINDGTYQTGLTGSSFASPIVAGAAGLIRSFYPTLNALQVAELLRITADPLMDTIPENLPFVQEKLGKGRINLYRALTDHTLPAIRVYEKHLINKFGEFASAGDTVEVQCKFRNYLQPTSNATADLTIVSGNASVINSSFTIGALNTLDSINNYSSPYKIYIDPNAPVDDIIVFRVGLSDPSTGYSDFQYFEITVNPSYLDIDTNQVRLTVTSDGRLGYPDDTYTTGNGLVYKTQEMIYESGLMISTGPTKVMDCVRSDPPGLTDFDFTYINNQKYTTLPEGDQGARAVITDIYTPDSIGLKIEQRSYAFHSSPNDKYVIIEYQIQNISGDSLDSLYVGLFTDWDIQIYSSNKANWDSGDSIGYSYYTGTGGLYGGVCLLTNNPPACFSMDNGSVGGNNINPNAGFNSAEKYYTLANGIARPTAGGSGSSGYDVSQVVGASLFKIANNETRTVAFAMVVGDNLTDLKKNARTAKNTFRFYNTSPLPVVSNQSYCKGDTVDVTIAPNNGSIFNFYNHLSDTIPFHTGANLFFPGLTKSDTVYVKGADSLFESSAVPVKVVLHAELSASYSYVPQTVDLSVSDAAYFVSTSSNAIITNWNMGDGTTYNDTTTVLHHYSNPGTYKVTLTVKDSYNCTDTISHFVKVIPPPYNHISPRPIVADQNYCKGDTVNVTIAPTNGSTFNFYNDSTSTTPIYSGSSYTINGLIKSDTIYVRGADSLYESTAVEVKIILHEELKASFIYNPKVIQLSTTERVSFVNTSQNASSISWDMGDGTVYQDSSVLNYHFNLPGLYKILLTAKGSHNCIDTVSAFIKITDTPDYPFVEDGIMLYPNPAHSQLNIRFLLTTAHNISIQIYNSLGQQMEKISAENVTYYEVPVSIDGKKKGMYYAKIDLGDKVVVRKFIIE